MIELIIPGEPQAKGRPRFYPIRTKAGRTFSRAVTPERTRNYEVYIRELFAVTYPGFVPMEGPLTMEVNAFLGIPKSTSRKRREAMWAGFIIPERRPDFDNLAKSAADALQGLAFLNDSQIAEAIIRKAYSLKPRLEIRIIPIITCGIPGGPVVRIVRAGGGK